MDRVRFLILQRRKLLELLRRRKTPIERDFEAVIRGADESYTQTTNSEINEIFDTSREPS